MGIWPSRTLGSSLKTKLSKYSGDTSQYLPSALKKKSYYTTGNHDAQPEQASKSNMREKPYEKHSSQPIMGHRAMRNDNLPKFVLEQAF